MNPDLAVASLAALAQSSRLAIFRLLVTVGPEGLAVGAIADALQIAPATLSFHLKNLTQAGLLLPRQEGRFIYYGANFAAMDDLIAFLTDNCCNGEACLPKTAASATGNEKRIGKQCK
jgi:DNA-binding transcriptional ArsR family regulator